jgi:hypothetical protein
VVGGGESRGEADEEQWEKLKDERDSVRLSRSVRLTR